jgi:hypothetical protein
MREPNRRTDLAREPHQGLPFASADQIGKELRSDLAELIIEELPAEIQALLKKLEQKLDRT